MPTEAEIEAASLAIIDYLDEFHPAPEGFLYTALARDALTAAEEVRGQAVPDEAAIRADEREQCAKIAEGTIAFDIDMWIGSTKESIAEATADAIASAIRAAAPKPENKP